jgi:hypothetical protein
MPSESTNIEAKGKIVATVHAERTSDHFLGVSTGFYGLP